MWQGLDPGPYLLAAYSVTAISIVIYSFWQIRQRNKLRQLESAMKQGGFE